MAKAKEKVEQKIQASVKDYNLLRRPFITEKSSQFQGVVFRVEKQASKDEIRGAVERVFGVEVTSVRTTTIFGKPKQRKRGKGRTSTYKKAYVAIREGQSIDLIEGV
jgi:large subunit ribosomal protein L23